MKKFISLALSLVLGQVALPDESDQNISTIASFVQEACGDEQVTRRVMDDFLKCMAAAEETRKKKEKAYLSRKFELSELNNKVKANALEISENEQVIKELEGITREEFEERADFCRRQESAQRTIDKLKERNNELSICNGQIRQQVEERKTEEVPRLEFDFSGQYAISVRYGTNEIAIGTFDVDKKVFPCQFRRRADVSKKINGCFFGVSITKSPENFLMGPFESNEKARSVKRDFLSGAVKWNSKCKCEFAVSIKKGVKRIKVKEGRREAKLSDRVKHWGSALGVALLAWAMDDMSVMQRSNLQPPPTHEVPPVYETCDAFYIDCKVLFLPKDK